MTDTPDGRPNAWPVDSTLHRCCMCIGRHAPDCAAGIVAHAHTLVDEAACALDRAADKLDEGRSIRTAETADRLRTVLADIDHLIRLLGRAAGGDL